MSHAEAIHLKASEYVLRRDLPDWSETDETALQNWLAETPHHKIAYLRAKTVWQRADRLQALHKEPRWRDAGLLGALARKAAVVTLMAAAAFGTYIYVSAPGEVLYATAIGGHETVPLADGTQIELNTDTAIRVRETPTQRIVKLERGEAWFDVKHDETRLFIVHAAGHRIVDIGTKFKVRSEGASLRVTLLEGSAQIENENSWLPGAAKEHRTALLKPGSVAVASPGKLAVTKEPLSVLESELGWRKGVLHFRHATLAEAIAELNRYNRQQLIIDDPKVAGLRISATLPTSGVDGFIRLAQEVFSIRVRAKDNAILLSR